MDRRKNRKSVCIEREVKMRFETDVLETGETVMRVDGEEVTEVNIHKYRDCKGMGIYDLVINFSDNSVIYINDFTAEVKEKV